MTVASLESQIASLTTELRLSTPSQERIVGKLSTVVKIAQHANEPMGCMVCGDAGVGKTTIAQALIQLFGTGESRRPGYYSHSVGSYYVRVPSPVSVGHLCSDMLRMLGDYSPDSGTVPRRTARLTRLIGEVRPYFIVLDEIQHLFREMAASKRPVVRDWLKNLVDQTAVPFVLVGNDHVREFLDEDGQSYRRFDTQIVVRTLNASIHEELEEFQKFVASYGQLINQQFCLDSEVDYKKKDFALALYSLTGGNLSAIRSAFQKALINSHLDGRLVGGNLSAVDFQGLHQDIYFSKYRVIENNPFEKRDRCIYDQIIAELEKGNAVC